MTAACSLMVTIEPESLELARGLKRRDPDLLDRLIEQYQFRLFRYLWHLTGDRQTAEDLFQETWVRVLERGHQYDGRNRFEAWLFSIARHLVIDRARLKKSSSLDALTDPNEPGGGVQFEDGSLPSPFEELSGKEEASRLSAAMQRIPATYREVLVLRFQEDLKLEEIGAVANIPLSTVKSRLYRGLSELRNLLEGDRP